MSDSNFKSLLDRASKEPLYTGDGATLDRAEVQARLPHRTPFLFVDEVHAIDDQRRFARARYTLSTDDAVFAGHFPGEPVWPGMLQVEAIGQLGVLLNLVDADEGENEPPVLTHVLGARFIKPIIPPAEVTIISTCWEDGLFFTVVGQCLVGDTICSAAAVQGL